MKSALLILLAAEVLAACGLCGQESAPKAPIGLPGRVARYRHHAEDNLRGSVVKTFSLALGPIEHGTGKDWQWLLLQATKADGRQFSVWLLCGAYPPETLNDARQSIARYILQEGASEPVEFRDQYTGAAVLPSVGGWPHLWPRSSVKEDAGRGEAPFPPEVRYLGHRYRLDKVEEAAPVPPTNLKRIELLPDLLIGPASNMRQKDETRRYDNTEYEFVRFTSADYREMAEAGINCVKVDAEQLAWVQDLNVFYWGAGVKNIPYPESLYRSTCLGPVIFLDEPGVVTRDSVIRPRLAKDEAFRKAITPQAVFAEFEKHFRHVLEQGAPTSLLKGLKARADVDVGDMQFAQENLFSWETIESSAAYQLSQDPQVPAAMVFEPPGRVGTLRTIPEWNMTYGCQLPVDDPKNFTSVIYGFLRGAARLADKSWGMSIYGAVDRADAFWYLSHAYDLGATRFHFWDSAMIACVPYGECLGLARSLRAHSQHYPDRDLRRLKHAAEVAILLPPGYNLGHVHLGKGNLWGVGELNLERVNRAGVKYRTVMGNFFTEIERYIRLGVAFDLLWDLPGIHPSGYREVIRIWEDGKVEVEQDGKRKVLKQARVPARPSGNPPDLKLELSATKGQAPLEISARARVEEKSAPVYYTHGRDTEGVYRNAAVAWEIYGPGEEDYRFLQPEKLKPRVVRNGSTIEAAVTFTLARPGQYRLRAATVDMAGRTAVSWTRLVVTE